MSVPAQWFFNDEEFVLKVYALSIRERPAFYPLQMNILCYYCKKLMVRTALVLGYIASSARWIDMQALGVDILYCFTEMLDAPTSLWYRTTKSRTISNKFRKQ